MKQAKKQKEVVKEEEESTMGQSQLDEDEEQPFTEIDQLQNHGINGGDINKLKGHGLCTILACLMTTRKEMLNIKGITEGKVDKIFEAAGKMEKMSFRSGI